MSSIKISCLRTDELLYPYCYENLWRKLMWNSSKRSIIPFIASVEGRIVVLEWCKIPNFTICHALQIQHFFPKSISYYMWKYHSFTTTKIFVRETADCQSSKWTNDKPCRAVCCGKIELLNHLWIYGVWR
jgi:hypothetical protein